MSYNMGKSFSVDSFDPVDIVLSTDDTFADMMVKSEENTNKTTEEIVRPYIEAGLMSMEVLDDSSEGCENCDDAEIISSDMLDIEADDIIESKEEDDMYDDDIGDMIDSVMGIEN